MGYGPDFKGLFIVDLLAITGAECVVTACAMFQLNLEFRGKVITSLPAFSVVELLAYGLGSGDWPNWFERHLIDPFPLFDSKGFQ